MERNRTAKIKSIFTAFISLVLITSSVEAQKKGPVLWNADIPTNINYQKNIIREANQAVEIISKQPYTVINKKSFSGDVHNYESLAYYAWPNPKNADSPFIVRDGYPSPEYKKYDATKLFNMCDNMKRLGLAYKLTRDQRYAKSAIKQLHVWFLDDSTKMSPNLDYGQIVPGYDNGKGHPGVLAEAYSLLDVLDCIALLQQDNLLDKKDYLGLISWFKEINVWLCNSRLGHIMDSTNNNLSVMYDVLRYRIALFTDSKKIKEEIRETFVQKRLIPQFLTDGRQPEELKRNKSMMYSIYNLNHLLQFCMMLQYDHYDYSKYKPRVGAAYSFIKKYISHKDKYPYQDIGDWTIYQSQFTEINNLFTSLFK